jgi:hypothetical protein
MRHKRQLQVVETTRYAEVVRAFAVRYPNALAKLDGVPQPGSSSQWCTNAKLKAANDFSLKEGDLEILGFHDGPRNMWAPDEALGLLNELAARKVLRLGRPAVSKRRGFFQWVFGK